MSLIRISLLSLLCVAVFSSMRAEEETDALPTDAIGKLNDAYVKAFNAGDAKQIGELFTFKADFTLLTGETVRGRKAIQEAHQSFFKNNPGIKASGKMESLRQIRKAVVIGHGNWIVENAPAGLPSKGSWLMVASKRGETWRYEAMQLMIAPSLPK